MAEGQGLGVLWGFPLTKPAEGDAYTVGVLPGTRLLRIVHHPLGWLVWTATKDYRYGTYLLLGYDGSITRVVTREEDNADEVTVMRPPTPPPPQGGTL